MDQAAGLLEQRQRALDSSQSNVQQQASIDDTLTVLSAEVDRIQDDKNTPVSERLAGMKVT